MKEYSLEEAQQSIDVLLHFYEGNVKFANWIVFNDKIELTIEQLEFLSTFNYPVDIKYKIAELPINDTIAANLRRNCKTKKIVDIFICNMSLSFQYRKKFLTQSFLKDITTGYRFYYRKDLLPQDIKDEIEKFMTCKDILE